MSETQDERLARLTELARKAMPGCEDYAYVERWGQGARVIAKEDGTVRTLIAIDHKDAHAALEAALVILADSAEDTPREAAIREAQRYEFERAEAAERELAILRGHCRSIAARWEDIGTPTGHRRDERWEWQEQVKRCAAELLAALDGTP